MAIGCSNPGGGGGAGASAVAPSPTPSPTPAATVAQPSATPRPTPSPAPTPERVSIFGSIVIKLDRGADVGSGVPVTLLDREKLEAGARLDSQRLGDELRARRNEISKARADASRIEREIVAIVNQMALDATRTWLAERDRRATPASTTPRYLEIEKNSRIRVFNSDIPIDPNVDNAIEQFRYLRDVVPQALEDAQRLANNDIDEARKLLAVEKRLYEESYQYRPALATPSLRKIGEYRERVEQNPYQRLADTIREMSAKTAAAFGKAEGEITEKKRQLTERIAPRIERSRAWIESHLPRLQGEAFERILKAAKVDEFVADKDGAFRFEVEAGSYALTSRYFDAVTGRDYVWLLAIRPGEQTLSTYNTMSLETLDGMPMVQRLIYAPPRGADDSGDQAEGAARSGAADAVSAEDWIAGAGGE
jgi:hypothetical protein